MSTITATVIITAVVVGGLVVSLLFVTVTYRQALREMSDSRERDSERRDMQVSAILDRFQAIRWEDLAAMRAIEEPQEGGFLSPEDQRVETQSIVVDEQMKWGPLSRLSQQREQEAAERALLAEDFPEEVTQPHESR